MAEFFICILTFFHIMTRLFDDIIERKTKILNFPKFYNKEQDEGYPTSFLITNKAFGLLPGAAGRDFKLLLEKILMSGRGCCCFLLQTAPS